MVQIVFQVEHVFPPDSRWDVLVRQLGSSDFSTAAATRLGDATVAEITEQPDGRDRQGRPRVDLYAVRLARHDQREQFRVGDRVGLAIEYAPLDSAR